MHRHNLRLRAIAPLAALVAALAACSPSPPGGNGNAGPQPASNRPQSSIPEPVDTTKDMPFDFSAIDFVDAKTGWVVGYDAEQNVSAIARTTDGGATWVKQVELAGDTLLDVDFADAANGWIAGTEGLVYRTTDGGATWSVEPAASWRAQHTTKAVEVRAGQAANSAPMLMNESIASVFFVDKKTGWAAGDAPTGKSVEVRGIVLGTTDGGATWKELTDASGKGAPYAINDVYFLDKTEGWAAGGNQENREEDVLLHTTDGGRTWLRQATKTAQYLRAVHFADSMRGWAVGMTIDPVSAMPGPSKIVGTTDGGTTWTVLYTSPRSFYDVVFTDAEHGWAVGDRAAIWATSDGGATWAQQTKFTVEGAQRMLRPGPDLAARPDATPFRTLFVLDPATVWAAGDGVILKRR
jgi:photosystem II stability/assembly factor-like uncharacterized protein